MGIVDLIADRPHEKAGVIPVSAHPAAHILLAPFIEKSGIVKLCLGSLPHVKGFT